jgi:hypothetical protein
MAIIRYQNGLVLSLNDDVYGEICSEILSKFGTTFKEVLKVL